MESKEIENCARAFAADLTIGGEYVPLERVIAAHLSAIASLRGAGLTWRAIAAILARSGARQRGGKPMSADQLRAGMSRQLRRRDPTKPAFPG